MVDSKPVSLKFFINPNRNKYLRRYTDLFKHGKPYKWKNKEFDWIGYINKESSQIKKEHRELGQRFLDDFTKTYLDMIATDIIDNSYIYKTSYGGLSLHIMIGEIRHDNPRYKYLYVLGRGLYTTYVYIGKYLMRWIDGYYLLGLSPKAHKRWRENIKNKVKYQKIPKFLY